MVEIDVQLLSTILGIISIAVGGIVAGYKICKRFDRMEERVDHSGKLHRVMVEGLYACLDGLHQQGCNGEVTKALNNLHKHLFEELEQ